MDIDENFEKLVALVHHAKSVGLPCRWIPVPVARGSKVVVNHRDTAPAKAPVLIGEFF
jgi:hypothetical protein